MAEMTLQKIRQRFSNTSLMTGSTTESGMRSLELVRIAVQSAFDKEIDELIKRYIEVPLHTTSLWFLFDLWY